MRPRVRTPRVNVTLGILLEVTACGGTTHTQPSSYAPIAASGSPHIAPRSIVLTPQETASPSSPDATFAAPLSLSSSEPNAHPQTASDVPKQEHTLPTVRETAIGYQSPQEQTRHSNVNWARWMTQCRGNPLHHCSPGLDPDCTPVVLDGKPYRIKTDTTAPRFAVLRGSEVVYRGSVPANWATTPIYALAIWQDSWLVEVHDELIVDGRSLNKEMGYSRAFNWVIWHDQPMYFFEREHVTRISYGGVVLSVEYDEVAHNLCCSEAMHNIVNCSDEVSFYAKRGSKWYYVQLAIPDPPKPN